MSISKFAIKSGFYDEDVLETEGYKTFIFNFHEVILFLTQVWRQIAPLCPNAYKPKEYKST